MYIISNPLGEHYYPQCTDKKNRESPKLRKQSKLYISSIFLPSVHCPSYECVQAAHLLFPSPASLIECPNPGHCLSQPPVISRPGPRPMSFLLEVFSLLSLLYFHPLSQPRCRKALVHFILTWIPKCCISSESSCLSPQRSAFLLALFCLSLG